MSSKTAQHLNLTQCKRIKANQYRSANNLTDYQAEEIDARIIELQSMADERMTNALTRSHSRKWIQRLVDEGITAQYDHQAFSVDEYWRLKNGSTVAIPPIIMSF